MIVRHPGNGKPVWGKPLRTATARICTVSTITPTQPAVGVSRDLCLSESLHQAKSNLSTQ